MDRRTFISGLAVVALATPGVTHAQPARKLYRIGIASVSNGSDSAGPQPRNPYARAFLGELHRLGYVYGEHFITEPRGAEGKPERYPVLAAELVGMQVDVIVAAGPALSALKQATTTIPIVMAAASDPVTQGFVQTLSHPGGNFTGLSHQLADTTGKRLDLLKQLVPRTTPVAVLWDRGSALSWQRAQTTARERGWKLVSLEIRDASDIEAAIKAATQARCGALLVLTGEIAFPHRQRIAKLAAKSRLPAMYDLRPYVEAGGLIAYSADLAEIWRHAAEFVDKILKGAKPADLPVEQPTKFELAINAKAAKALNLAIPESLRLQAQSVE